MFQAEILAIKKCAEWLLRQRTTGRAVSICADSAAALAALDSFRVESRLVLECRAALDALGRCNKVQLMWVPAHVGVPGNEKADYLAKRGARIAEPTDSVRIPWCEVTAAISEWKRAERSRLWSGGEDCRQAKLALGPSPAYRWSRELLQLPKKDVRVVVGWITGNCLFNHHRFTGRETRTCRFCQEEVESTEHILWRCPAVEERRRTFLGGGISEMEGGLPLRPAAVLRFVKSLGIPEEGEL